jgi:crotonobetainyl-CoA:carnitine CoA-transferase CaiB-like acyl-CoA transferase
MAGALSGIRAVELAVMQNGPACGYMLGDMGAEVIKIEQPERGDSIRGMSDYGETSLHFKGVNLFYETPNRSKKGITLDLKKERGREVLYRLVRKSDVFFTNFSKRVCSDLGCDYETLCKYNPKIIYGIAAGFGTRGPEGDQRAFDTAAQARSGFMMLTGDASGPPATAGGAVIDQAGATMLAYGILAALVARERMGIGQEVEASLLGSAIHLQAMAVNRATIQGKLWSQHDRLRAQNPLGNYYKCADGKWIMLAEVQSDRFWHDFCNALGIPELENDPRFATRHDRKVNDAECVSILDQVFETKPRDEWMTILREKAKGMACAEVFELTEVVHQPQVLENEYVVDYEHPVVGPVKLIGYPVRFSKTPAKIASKAPEFGEHTEEVLLTVGGYSWEEIESLRNEGII